MPCKGDEPRLGENIEAILNQNYPNYRTIIVTDTPQDPAYHTAKKALDRHPTGDVRLCTSHPLPNASGKVAALLTALDEDGWQSDAYAFIDSDALTTVRWLAHIIEPLHDPSVGATTGFRWYFPARGGFWSHSESAWNASGTNLMFNERYNFPWGGAMAILTEKMRTIGLREVWETATSDDLSLDEALREHNFRTIFVPQCTVVTYNQATLRSFLGWATRQVALTKMFNRRLWNYGLAAYAFFTLVAALGVMSLIVGVLWSSVWFLPSVLLLMPSILGVYRADQRVSTFKGALPEFGADFERNRMAASAASLIVPWVMTYCIIKSAQTREIEWRGRRYKMPGGNSHASARSFPEASVQKGT
jgi:cellulose synthase/poly-beta-1,6-N-acetylglucosamine synthase-like glycosyltransferase